MLLRCALLFFFTLVSLPALGNTSSDMVPPSAIMWYAPANQCDFNNLDCRTSWQAGSCSDAANNSYNHMVAASNPERTRYDNLSSCIPTGNYSAKVTYEKQLKYPADNDWRAPKVFQLEVRARAICPSGYTAELVNNEVYQCKRTGQFTNANGMPDTCEASPMAGNPINVANGNKYQEELDYQAAAPSPIEFSRFYNSAVATDDPEANPWSHSYDYHIRINAQTDAHGPVDIDVVRPDGSRIRFYSELFDTGLTFARRWYPYNPDKVDHYHLSATYSSTSFTDPLRVTEWLLHTPDTTEVYGDDGRILTLTSRDNNSIELQRIADTLTVTGPLDEKIEIVFDEQGQPDQLTTPIGVFDYYYSAPGQLRWITYPDGRQRHYHYNADVGRHKLLTGITDERGILYANWYYDETGRAFLSRHALDDGKVEIDFHSSSTSLDSKRTVTNSRGFDTVYLLDDLYGTPIVASITDCHDCGFSDASFVYDEFGNLEESTIDDLTVWQGSFDEMGNPGGIIEGLDTSLSRFFQYTWEPGYAGKPKTVHEPSILDNEHKITTNTYDENGNPASSTIDGFHPDGSAVRRTIHTEFNGPLNQLSKIDGPRDDVIDHYEFLYYSVAGSTSNRGRLWKVTNPMGHVLYDNMHYSETGKLISYEGPNSLRVDIAYEPGNDRMSTLARMDLLSGETRKTHWTYLPTGEVETITVGYLSASETTLTLEYDDARRLKRIYDGAGNYIEFTLDTEGNAEHENVYDLNGALQKALSRAFDANNRANLGTQENESLSTQYYADGRLKENTDGNGIKTEYSYDELKRLTHITRHKGGTTPATADSVTMLDWDVQDNLVGVTDPNGGRTRYSFDDLGNLVEISSPDTGTTVFEHDEAGNSITRTDAKGQIFHYEYDALNRLERIDAPGEWDDAVYSYDSCTGGIGRVCTITRGLTTLEYAYNAFGDIIGIDQAVETFANLQTARSTLGYQYDAAGRIQHMTYPSGNRITYTYDESGNIYSVSLNGGETILVTDTGYVPFGGKKSERRGNGTEVRTQRDRAYREYLEYGGGYYEYRIFDANGNTVSQYVPYTANFFDYDALDRLDTASGQYGSYDYLYDRNGNRLEKSIDGSTTQIFSYETASNRMTAGNGAAVSLDENGNTTSLRGMELIYSSDNRLIGITGKSQYQYNGVGQRVYKATKNAGYSTETAFLDRVIYMYDTEGHLLAEIGPTGRVHREYVYTGNELLAIVDHTPDTHEPIRNADMDNDGTVGVEDFIVWLYNAYNTQGPSGDVNSDGTIDQTDFNLVLDCALSGGQNTACSAASFKQEIYYSHNDHLGTPRLLTDEQGVAVWRADYHPFGMVDLHEDLDGDGIFIALNIRFPGQYYDAESGLHYNYFRTYDPESGRYITSDPIGLSGGLNTYIYTLDNPLLFIDPYGTDNMSTFIHGLSGIKPTDKFPASLEEVEALSINRPTLPHERPLENYGKAWVQFMIFAPLPEAKAATACGKYLLEEQRLNKALCTFGFCAAGLRGETLDTMLEHLLIKENLRLESNIAQQVITHAPK